MLVLTWVKELYTSLVFIFLVWFRWEYFWKLKLNELRVRSLYLHCLTLTLTWNSLNVCFCCERIAQVRFSFFCWICNLSPWKWAISLFCYHLQTDNSLLLKLFQHFRQSVTGGLYVIQHRVPWYESQEGHSCM